jgi:hypothetical protein
MRLWSAARAPTACPPRPYQESKAKVLLWVEKAKRPTQAAQRFFAGHTSLIITGAV